MIGLFFLALILGLCLLYFVFVFSLYIRRWHDLGQSGWYSLLMIIPFVSFVALIYLMFAKGDEGPNAYGEPNVGKSFWASLFGSSTAAPVVQQQAVTPAPVATPSDHTNMPGGMQ
jgi:hypothetical protein